MPPVSSPVCARLPGSKLWLHSAAACARPVSIGVEPAQVCALPTATAGFLPEVQPTLQTLDGDDSFTDREIAAIVLSLVAATTFVTFCATLFCSGRCRPCTTAETDTGTPKEARSFKREAAERAKAAGLPRLTGRASAAAAAVVPPTPADDESSADSDADTVVVASSSAAGDDIGGGYSDLLVAIEPRSREVKPGPAVDGGNDHFLIEAAGMAGGRVSREGDTEGISMRLPAALPLFVPSQPSNGVVRPPLPSQQVRLVGCMREEVQDLLLRVFVILSLCCKNLVCRVCAHRPLACSGHRRLMRMRLREAAAAPVTALLQQTTAPRRRRRCRTSR